VIGGLAAPLLYLSPTQINAIVPYGIPVDAQVPVEIHRGGSVVFSWTLESVARNATPLLRFRTDGVFQLLANAVNEDGTANSQQNPARTGSMVTVYATGFGQLTPAQADGAPATASGTPLPDGGVGIWNSVTRATTCSGERDPDSGLDQRGGGGEVSGSQPGGAGSPGTGILRRAARDQPLHPGGLHLRDAMSNRAAGGKNEKANLSKAEGNAMKRLVLVLVAGYPAKR